MHNIRRRNETSRVRESRIINGYVLFKHPGIYAKAKDFYAKLDALYPAKKDLRKTYEYQAFITGLKDNKYKYERRSQDERLDTMVLEIPLLDKADIPTVVPDVAPAIPTVVPDVAPAIPTVVPDVAPAIPTVVSDVAPAIPTVVPAIPTVVPDIGAEITLPVLPDEIINEIINDLSQDF